MTREEANKKLRDIEYSKVNFSEIWDGSKRGSEICLDGIYTLAQLKKMVDIIERYINEKT